MGSISLTVEMEGRAGLDPATSHLTMSSVTS